MQPMTLMVQVNHLNQVQQSSVWLMLLLNRVVIDQYQLLWYRMLMNEPDDDVGHYCLHHPVVKSLHLLMLLY
mgnify:CR=1 FL=1